MSLLSSFRAGYLSPLLSLNATQYLTQERGFIPWEAASSTFTYISRMLALTDHIEVVKVRLPVYAKAEQ